MATEVLFRKEGKTVLAVFPYEPADAAGNFPCYATIGQHGACALSYYQKLTRPAKPDEYAGLLSELQRQGYDDLKVIKRINYARLSRSA